MCTDWNTSSSWKKWELLIRNVNQLEIICNFYIVMTRWNVFCEKISLPLRQKRCTYWPLQAICCCVLDLSLPCYAFSIFFECAILLRLFWRIFGTVIFVVLVWIILIVNIHLQKASTIPLQCIKIVQKPKKYPF